MLEARGNGGAGLDLEKSGTRGGRNVGYRGNPRASERDLDIAKATDLLAQLEQTARGHGYHDFSEMQRRVVEEREKLGPENQYQLLKRIAPALHEADQYVKRRTLPGVDATGLVAIQDMIKSVSRLIRVLLLGYTLEEREELADRIKAERAAEIDSAVGISFGEARHRTALNRISRSVFTQSLGARMTRLLQG